MTDVLNDGRSNLTVIDHMGSDQSVVRAARVSYDKDRKEYKETVSSEEFFAWRGEKDVKLIRYMADNNHGTPFEHTTVTFHVACPLFVVRQWHRHRIGWSYNELSRRYTSEEIYFHVPNEWRKQNNGGNKQGSHAGFSAEQQVSLTKAYMDVLSNVESLYDLMIKWGVANEQARMVLPQSMYTRFYATGNLRSFAHFMHLRDDEHAQPEIRAYASAMREELRKIYPVSLAALMGEHRQKEVHVPWWKKLPIIRRYA